MDTYLAVQMAKFEVESNAAMRRALDVNDIYGDAVSRAAIMDVFNGAIRAMRASHANAILRVTVAEEMLTLVNLAKRLWPLTPPANTSDNGSNPYEVQPLSSASRAGSPTS